MVSDDVGHVPDVDGGFRKEKKTLDRPGFGDRVWVCRNGDSYTVTTRTRYSGRQSVRPASDTRVGTLFSDVDKL